jgi:RES domain
LALVPVPAPCPATPTFSRGVKLETLELGTEILRIHQNAHGPVFFGPLPPNGPSYRFDAPNAEYRVCYTAHDIDGAFVETILHGKTTASVLSRAYLEERAFSRLTVQRDLRLAMLHGEGLSWCNTDASISAVPVYAEPRRIALALFNEIPDLDGIAYRSRHDNGAMCFALFDRVDVADLPVTGTQRFDKSPAVVDRLARKYGVIFDTSKPVPPPPKK